MRVQVPPIKCQGTKTKLVPTILREIERDPAGVWVEPFPGSGVVALNVAPRPALLADRVRESSLRWCASHENG